MCVLKEGNDEKERREGGGCLKGKLMRNVNIINVNSVNCNVHLLDNVFIHSFILSHLQPSRDCIRNYK